jgi:flagellar hook protein FlgE
MLESIYIGMTGLNSYSRGLQSISNNVANLNTPGFKSSSLQFADLFYIGRELGGPANGDARFGMGVTYTNSTLNFRQGELRTSSGDLDLAILGRGFLTLIKDGTTLYARTGQFSFDTDGYLVETNLNRQLGLLTPSGALQAFNISDKRTNPPKATTEVKFIDNLSATATEHVLTADVFDANGGAQKLTIRFTNAFATTVGKWTVVVEDDAGNKLAEGELQFNGSTPVPGQDKISVDIKSATGVTSTVVLDFSSGVTGFSSGTSSSLRIESTDGYAVGELTSVVVDEDGQLKLEYSNAQSETVGYIAIADFADLQGLTQNGNGLFEPAAGAQPRIGRQGDGGLGEVKGASFEASNVDLSQEFGQLILYQRGYQASSQVISVANEMIQQLFELRSRG